MPATSRCTLQRRLLEPLLGFSSWLDIRRVALFKRWAWVLPFLNAGRVFELKAGHIDILIR